MDGVIFSEKTAEKKEGQLNGPTGKIPTWEPNSEKKELSDEQKLAKLTKKSGNILFKAKTIFPFTLFIDEIVISEEKVSVIHRLFFFSEQVRSVLGKDIANVTVQTNLFFGTLIILDRYYADDPIIINYLQKEDAMKARRIIQGMIVTQNQGIDVTKLEVPNLEKKLEAIGSSHS